MVHNHSAAFNVSQTQTATIPPLKSAAAISRKCGTPLNIRPLQTCLTEAWRADKTRHPLHCRLRQQNKRKLRLQTPNHFIKHPGLSHFPSFSHFSLNAMDYARADRRAPIGWCLAEVWLPSQQLQTNLQWLCAPVHLRNLPDCELDNVWSSLLVLWLTFTSSKSMDWLWILICRLCVLCLHNG